MAAQPAPANNMRGDQYDEESANFKIDDTKADNATHVEAIKGMNELSSHGLTPEEQRKTM